MSERPIRARGNDENGEPVYIIGLTGEHLEHVRKGNTVIIDLLALGARGQILIYGGKDRAQLLRVLEAYTGADTKYIDGMRAGNA